MNAHGTNLNNPFRRRGLHTSSTPLATPRSLIPVGPAFSPLADPPMESQPPQLAISYIETSPYAPGPPISAMPVPYLSALGAETAILVDLSDIPSPPPMPVPEPAVLIVEEVDPIIHLGEASLTLPMAVYGAEVETCYQTGSPFLFPGAPVISRQSSWSTASDYSAPPPSMASGSMSLYSPSCNASLPEHYSPDAATMDGEAQECLMAGPARPASGGSSPAPKVHGLPELPPAPIPRGLLSRPGAAKPTKPPPRPKKGLRGSISRLSRMFS